MGRKIRDAKAEVIIDLLQNNSPKLYENVKSDIGHFIVCGSIWMFGMARSVPTPGEIQGPCLDPAYAKRFEEMLEVRRRATAEGVPFTALMEPNICGPFKIPLDCKGGRSLDAHRDLQRGLPVILPAPGNNLIGPCDAEDVANAFVCALEHRAAAAGHLFNVGSAYSLTMERFVEAYSEIYDVKIPIEYVRWDEFKTTVVPEPEAHWHFEFNMCPDIKLISNRLAYRPMHTPEQSMHRAVEWMKQTNLL